MSSIKSRLYLLLFVNIIIFSAITTGIISLYHDYYDNTLSSLEKANQSTSYTLEAQVHFKRQVQEWKNVLLRGHNPQDYKKYLNKFKDEEQAVKHNIAQLKPLIKGDSDIFSMAENFIQAHQFLSSQYQKALKVYDTSSSNPHIAADKLVRGIDRAPSNLLDQLVTAIKEQAKNKQSSVLAKFSIAEKSAIGVSIFAIVILTIGYSVALRQLIFKPISEFSFITKSLTSKHKDLTQRLNITSCQEFSEISHNFNLFIERVQKMIEDIQKAAGKLQSASVTSAQVTEKTNQNIIKQNQDITNLNSSMSHITSSINDVATLANNATNTAENASEKANQGEQEVDKINNIINDLNSNIESTADVINELAVQFESINNFSDMITTISEQTSLLSLNAAIEAARAGENGRGFAVVADEVRSLANKSQEATQQIKTTIDYIQKSSKKTLEAVSQSKNIAKECNNQALEVENALNDIQHSVEDILTMNKNIKTSAVEQQSQVDGVSSLIQKIEQDLQNTSQGSRQNTSDNSDLAQLTVMLQMMINEFTINTNEIQTKNIEISAIEDNDNISLF